MRPGVPFGEEGITRRFLDEGIVELHSKVANFSRTIEFSISIFLIFACDKEIDQCKFKS